MLSQSGTERSPGPVTSLPEVDHSLEVVLLNPADRVTEGHVPGDVSASQGLPHDFNDRLGDVLKAVCRGDRAIVRLEQVTNKIFDILIQFNGARTSKTTFIVLPAFVEHFTKELRALSPTLRINFDCSQAKRCHVIA